MLQWEFSNYVPVFSAGFVFVFAIFGVLCIAVFAGSVIAQGIVGGKRQSVYGSSAVDSNPIHFDGILRRGHYLEGPECLQ